MICKFQAPFNRTANDKVLTAIINCRCKMTSDAILLTGTKEDKGKLITYIVTIQDSLVPKFEALSGYKLEVMK